MANIQTPDYFEQATIDMLRRLHRFLRACAMSTMPMTMPCVLYRRPELTLSTPPALHALATPNPIQQRPLPYVGNIVLS